MRMAIPTAVAALTLLGACATTADRTASAEEQAHCEAMARKMGTGQQHSHAEMKGVASGTTAMNRDHARCREIMSKEQ